MRSKFLGIGISLLFFLILELVVRFFGIHYLEQPEIFFVNLKKNFVESGKGNADIIVLGDSRSMALAGYPKDSETEYSVYNHSLPAMGPKYYRFFLDKYLKKGNTKPKMVLFAASPKLYSTGYGPPLYDPDAKSVKENESISAYMKRRWNEGIEKNFFRTPTPNNIISYSGKQEDANQILWEFFGHRYLHQFTFAELSEQYSGVERLFILSKSAPLLYQSYRFHGAIRNALSQTNWKVDKNYKEKSLFCESCENVEAGLCKPASSQLEDNLTIEDQITRHFGKYNISNRLKPELVLFSKDMIRKELDEELKNPKPYVYEKPDFIVLKELIEYTKTQGIEFGLVYMPWILEKQESQESKDLLADLKLFFRENPEAKLFFFPESSYPSDRFVDNIHYDCRGEKRVNEEFRNSVLPQVFRFLHSKEKSN
ncbi:DUF1574 domain-containing protein [Leptospira sp. 2 VSF19]|uniref:DUF1574 domain-containing protein n=1 Tax=Leptospira soteropolitanensis TaxID=2950025 RepID=A0AAW5VCS6_9LEPT|nr:DUF1574 family protein [Leptospira soteropolitanensis]MCW7491847.1 DUF1574 domain-containing protein [Leptospira soteropolitanensis]MCW7499431.1 DUF1574 domain-containing protein [Leptospira soteropolitanensis]MCW7520978.1 DUF1574 domain-containing protein [Leptospira soteropolitanensis]MCW7525535.1 DUF1574 domain-containing protein [Leptospira soteropolitanensis]MCW7529401.1 DUF1574 domain-containing protein [Leptospira soteropolitanensis]